MEAGPQLNRLIGEKLFGYWVDHYDKDVAERCYYVLLDEHITPVAPFAGWRTGERKTEAEAWADCPDFSGDLAAAWQVVEILREKGFRFTLYDQPGTGIRIAQFFNDAEYGASIGAETEPHAICLAALAACGIEVPV